MDKVMSYSVHLKPIKLANISAAPKEDLTSPPETTAPLLNNIESNATLLAAPTIDDSVANTAEIISPINLAALHQQFMEDQAQVQTYFLELQSQMLQLILTEEGEQDNTVVAESTVQPSVNLPGPKFSRADLEVLASGKISSVFGDWFKPLDQYARLIRMPEPPLLLADRVTGIDAVPGSIGVGTLWTETDVVRDAWYMHHNRIPTGIMIESGQADLLLISWLGLDFYNRGERVYRLLGSEVTLYGSLAKPGETLCFEIHVDGHANHGDVRLFFFHYDCFVNGELRMTVRNGQAGFFTAEELANSGGVLWQPEDAEVDTSLSLDPPTVKCQYTAFNKKQLHAFSQGDAYACFGQGFEFIQTHTRTPCISPAPMLFLDEITDFDIQGGPLRRGYMRAIQNITADDWFFKGHFKNDPCMPGTLMLEAGLQVLQCYMTALGYTTRRDGWRFEPVPEQAYKLICRGQVLPSSKQVVYEIFVCSVTAEPIPMLTADLLATVDGLKAFHTRLSLRLMPDWPLADDDPLLVKHVDPKPAAVSNGFKFGYAALLAAALGKPSTGNGPLYTMFDNHRRMPRLPAPPYHFMSRLVDIQGEMGQFVSGVKIICEYDVPPDAWYFAKNSTPLMPYSVFLESALQPCGWLAFYIGSIFTSSKDLVFRNLDGTGTLNALITPGAGTIQTHVECTNISQSAGMIIQSFKVKSYIAGKLIYNMDTVFGFFPKEAFDNQVGIPPNDEEKQRLIESSDFFVDLTKQPATYFNDDLRLATPNLLMLDRVTGFWPKGGKKGLGFLRAEKSVNPAEWFFKAHFFQDPVQPGSLGIEAMIQLLQFYMLEQGMHKNISEPYFEPLALDLPLSWKYRGQVVPTNQCIMTTIEITAITQEEHGVLVTADAELWVDGIRVYVAQNLGMRIVSAASKDVIQSVPYHFDLAVDQWVTQHCPNYLIPTLPMMSMLDMIADSASRYFSDKKCIAIKEMQVLAWALANQPITIKAFVEKLDNTTARVILKTCSGEFKTLASGIVVFADHYPSPPVPPAPLSNAQVVDGIYDALFHGPVFQIAKKLMMGDKCATVEIDAAVKNAPFGFMNHILLDASIHGIPHYNLSRWSSDVAVEALGYPTFIPSLERFAETPRAGIVKSHAKFLGFYHSKYFPRFEITLSVNDVVFLKYELIDTLFYRPKFLLQSPEKLRMFVQNREYVADMSLSQLNDQKHFYIAVEDIKQMNLVAGAVEALYQVSGTLSQMTLQVLLKEYVGREEKIHPSQVTVVGNSKAFANADPDQLYIFKVQEKDDIFTILEATKIAV